jgi:hypothetical protein
MGLKKTWNKGIGDLKKSWEEGADDLKRSAQEAKGKALDVKKLATKDGRAAARSDAQERRETARSAYVGALERAVEAADWGDVLAEERAAGEALAAARADDSVKQEFDERWGALLRAKKLRRSEFLGSVADMHFYRDRIISRDGVRVMDEHYRATVDAAGNITTAYKPTVKRMAALSVLPGSALAPGMAMQKEMTRDYRELYFLVEHPDWARVERVNPVRARYIRQLAANINAAAAAAGMSTQSTDAGHGPAEPEDSLEKLKKLGELRDAGVLSEDEFSQAKQRLLRRLS